MAEQFWVCHCDLSGECHVSRGKGDHCELCAGPEPATADNVEGMFVGYRDRVNEAQEIIRAQATLLAELRPLVLNPHVTDNYFGDLTPEGQQLKAKFDAIAALVEEEDDPCHGPQDTTCGSCGLGLIQQEKF